jgi:hypothetical protein
MMVDTYNRQSLPHRWHRSAATYPLAVMFVFHQERAMILA